MHVVDLADLYEIVVRRLLLLRAGGGGEGGGDEDDLPSGEKGIYFSATGRHTWLDVAEGVGDALFALGVSRTEEVRSISLEEGAEKWTGGDTVLAELGFASK